MNTRIRQKIARRLADRKGASIAEMMVTMVILLLAMAIVISGVTLANGQYHRSLILSEEKVLASSLSNLIQSELANVRTVTISGDDLVSFISKSYGLEEA